MSNHTVSIFINFVLIPANSFADIQANIYVHFTIIQSWISEEALHYHKTRGGFSCVTASLWSSTNLLALCIQSQTKCPWHEKYKFMVLDSSCTIGRRNLIVGTTEEEKDKYVYGEPIAIPKYC